MNLLRLSNLCHDENSSVQFLQQHRIIHPERQCGNGHNMTLTFGNQIRWRCRIRGCREERGIRTNNWLNGSRLPFRKIVLFVYCWAHEMHGINFCERELEISSDSVVDWCNYLREVCADNLIANPQVIGGPGRTVEIDESLFTRRKNQAGRVFPQQWVFGGICREDKNCFIFAVPDRSADTLIPIIQNQILPGTTILSDQWRAYNNIANNGQFAHMTVNHSLNFVDPVTGVHTQNIERLWESAKERNKKQNGTHRQMLDSYLCEFMWRKRVQTAGLDPFETILNHIATFWPPN